MAFTSLEDAEVDVDIIPGTVITATAGAAIKAGQTVYLSADKTVKPQDNTTEPIVYDDTIGVAAYDVASGEKVGIYSVGSIVRTRWSGGTSASAGDWVWGSTGGFVRSGTYTNSGCGFAQLMKAPTANEGIVEIFIH